MSKSYRYNPRTGDESPEKYSRKDRYESKGKQGKPLPPKDEVFVGLSVKELEERYGDEYERDYSSSL